MCGIAMTQHMCMHFFDDARLSGHCFYGPLHPTLAVPAIKAFALRIAIAFKQKLFWLCCFYVFFYTTNKMYREWYVSILVAFALYNAQEVAIKIHVLQLYVPYFHAAQAAAIEQTNKNFVFEQLCMGKHCPQLLSAKDHR